MSVQFLKHYLGAPQAFAAFEKMKERFYQKQTTCANCQGLKSLEYVQKSSSSQSRKQVAQMHTQDDYYTLTGNTFVRVITNE